MSYAKTIGPFKDGTKDVTRRLGWVNLKPGEHYTAVEKAQGLKKGEHVKRMEECICISNVAEPLQDIILRPLRYDQVSTQFPRREVEREGFPLMSAKEFVDMFCEFNNKPGRPCTPETEVQRIVFGRYVA